VAATRIDLKPSNRAGGIWLLDLVRGVSTRFTFDLSLDSSPVWSPDGTRVAFSGGRADGYGIYQKAANGTGKEQTLRQEVPDRHGCNVVRSANGGVELDFRIEEK
jgi:Tol biopolymer transport system component